MTKITVEDKKMTPDWITLDSVCRGYFYRIVSWEDNRDLHGKLVIGVGQQSVILIDDSTGYHSVAWCNSNRTDMNLRLEKVKEVKITVIG